MKGYPLALSWRIAKRRTHACSRAVIVILAVGKMACGEVTGGHNVDVRAPKLDAVASAHQASSVCDISGTWALHFALPVSFGNWVIKKDTDVIHLWARAKRTVDLSGNFIDHVEPCGISMPAYTTRRTFGGETLGVVYPDHLFDDARLRATTTTGRIQASTAGSTWEWAPAALQMGIDLVEPSSAKWPRSAAAMMPFLIDADILGNKGVSIATRSDGGMTPAAVDMAGKKRVGRFFVAVRNVVGAQGDVIDCHRWVGEAWVPKLHDKLAIDSTVLGCELLDKQMCQGKDVALANRFAINYTMLPNARSTMLKVADDTRCATIRGLDFE